MSSGKERKSRGGDSEPVSKKYFRSFYCFLGGYPIPKTPRSLRVKLGGQGGGHRLTFSDPISLWGSESKG